MGGVGSGTWYRWNKKTKLEETKRIDIHSLKKLGFLNANCSGSLSWNRRGQPIGHINVRMIEDRMILSYRYRENGSEWEPVDQTVTLTETPCNYGKVRKWFLCPCCDRRVGVLSLNGKLFLCRHCYRLPHASSSECRIDRMIRARDKLKDRAYDETGYRKKKGMHRKTFERLSERYWQIDWAVDEFIEGKLDALKGLK